MTEVEGKIGCPECGSTCGVPGCTCCDGIIPCEKCQKKAGRKLTGAETRELLQLMAGMDHHIRYNHIPCPPNPDKVASVCTRIVRRFNGIGMDADHDLSYQISTPSGVRVTAQELVDAYHLSEFLNWET